MSVEKEQCGVWSVECRVWSVECGVKVKADNSKLR